MQCRFASHAGQDLIGFRTGKFGVCQTTKADWNDEAFEALVLDEGLKSFIRDLVAEHRVTNNKPFDNIVRDKGRGLFGLLAGSPGVGKVLLSSITLGKPDFGIS